MGAEELNYTPWSVKDSRCVMSGPDTNNDMDCNVINKAFITSGEEGNGDETIHFGPTGNRPALKENEQVTTTA